MRRPVGAVPNRGTGSEGPTVIQELVETGTSSVPRETLGEIGTGSEVPVGAVPNTGTASVGHEFVEIGTGSMGHWVEDGGAVVLRGGSKCPNGARHTSPGCNPGYGKQATDAF